MPPSGPIAEEVDRLAELMRESLRPSYELSTAIARLEEAGFWASRAPRLVDDVESIVREGTR